MECSWQLLTSPDCHLIKYPSLAAVRLGCSGVERSAGSRRLTVSADARAIAWMPPDQSAGSQHSHEDADDTASLGVPALPTSAQAQALQLPMWHRQPLM